MRASTRFIIEVRDENGRLDFNKELEVKKNHPFLFSRREFSIDQLCGYATSVCQGRNNSIGPHELQAFMSTTGACYRVKTW